MSRVLRFVTFGLLVASAIAQSTERSAAPILAGRPEHGLPGAALGSERWIVHFASRSFDLSGFRAAIRAHRPAAEVDAIIAQLEQAVQADQAEFVAAIVALGGKVTNQWWLVNAAAVEIAPAQLDALRRLPNVAFVQPDEERMPAIKTATNGSNHRADALQAQGFVGAGVTVAVVDTGQDENVAGTGRPHRTYFVNGDPLNTSGGGIGGSRLLINRQMGALPADDPHGHGTGVASICAGANWATTGADDGHAPMAGIAGYAMSNNTSGSTSLTIMANAWQQVATDRANYTIVASNMSYSASPDPLDISSQAIDSTAFNADVMCCVAGGNTGTSTVVSCSCANGLAVAALDANVHTVAGFSSRGPLSGDPQRTYPDIAGCGVSTVMAARDNEATDYVDSGTSMASPQVTGAATQLRARFPALTTLETKAVLLASAVGLETQNPGLGRNDFGVGILRNDRAHAIAAAAQLGSGTLTAAAPQQTFAVPVQAGQSYRLSLTWFRQVLGVTTWSNLDLACLDGNGNVIAQSNTPRNLYEVLDVFVPFTGTMTVRVTGTLITNPTEEFAWAWTDAPPVPVHGAATSFGTGCAPIGLEWNAPGPLVAATSANEFAYGLVASAPTTVTGMEIYTQSTGASSATVVACIYLPNGGQPAASPARVSAVMVGTQPGFYRANFSTPLTIPAGPFYIALDHRFGTVGLSNVASGVTSTCFQRPTLLSGAWAASPLTIRPVFRLLTDSAATGGLPSLTVAGQPTIGQTSTFNLGNGPDNGVMLLGIGYSNSTSSFGNLPLALDLLGAPGCTLLGSAEVLEILLTSPTGTASWPLAVPNLTTLVGLHLYGQGISWAPGANQFGLLFSAGVDFYVGN